MLCRKSPRDRVRVKLKEIREELLRRRHQPIREQGKWLRQVVCEFFAYPAVPTNSHALAAFHHHVPDLWRRSLRRRCQRDMTMWERTAQLTSAKRDADCWVSARCINSFSMEAVLTEPACK